MAPSIDEQSIAQNRTPNTIVRIGMMCVLVPLWILCMCWTLGRHWMLFDLIASHQLLWILLLLLSLFPITLLWKLRYKRFPIRSILLSILILIVGAYPAVQNRIWLLPKGTRERAPLDSIRIVSSNIHPANKLWEKDLDTLMGVHADVIMILEISPELSRAIRNDHYLDESDYPNWVHRYWVEHETSPCLILSKWPITKLPKSDTLTRTQNHLYARIDHPIGELIVGAMHPLSPRTADRWSEGNQTLQTQVLRVHEIRESSKVPIIVGVDLNAGPGQYRASILRESDLVMSKPILRVGGTFPTHTPIPDMLQIQLDDVWTSNELVPISWSSFELIGSDHRAVMVDLKLRQQ